MGDGILNSILLHGAGLLCMIAISAQLAEAHSLGDYVSPCRAADPAAALNECVKQAAQQLIARAAGGIPELDIRPLDPAQVSKLALAREGTLSMSLTFSNSTHYGLGGVQVKSASVDPHKHLYKFTVFIPKYIVSGYYDVNGRVILLPITGHGVANITMIGIDSDWVFSGEKETRDGQDFLKLTKLVTKINDNSPKKVELHFDGLFGGNKVLGDTMNDFMNQNWKELTKQLKPSVQASFDKRLLPVAQRFVAKFPLKELFADL